MKSRTLFVVRFLLGLCLSFSALGAVVSVKVGDYIGEWSIKGQSSRYTGNQDLELSGSISILIAEAGEFLIEVDSNGGVVVNNDSAVGGIGEVSFNTVSIKVDPGLYEGLWGFIRVSKDLSGIVDNIMLVRGVNYRVQVAEIGSFDIKVSSDGLIESLNTAAGFSSEAGVLNLKTTDLSINTSDYVGLWGIERVNKDLAGSLANLKLVPGVNYRFSIAEIGSFDISLLESGEVSVLSSIAATGSTNGVVTFNTISLDIDPAKYLGLWFIRRMSNDLTGLVQGIRVLPEMNYRIAVGEVGNFDININVQANGVITVLNEDAAFSPEAGKLVFKTQGILVTPADLNDSWSIRRVADVMTGESSLDLVMGVNYRFIDEVTRESTDFNLDCSLSPIELNLSGKIFSIKCVDDVPDFECESINDYEEHSCRGYFIAKNNDDLLTYKSTFGLRKGKYRSLVVGFDLEGEDLRLQSPCQVYLYKKINASNVCIDGREGVVLASRSSIVANLVDIKSDKSIKVLAKAGVVSPELKLQASNKIFISPWGKLESDEIEVTANKCFLSRDLDVVNNCLDTKELALRVSHFWKKY